MKFISTVSLTLLAFMISQSAVAANQDAAPPQLTSENFPEPTTNLEDPFPSNAWKTIVNNRGYNIVNYNTSKDNETKITTNIKAISRNTDNINTNTDNINTNTGKIATNENNIATNMKAINQNTNNINTNTSKITTNFTAISRNTDNIDTNTSKIATNENNIGINKTTLDQNTSAIAENKAAINQNTTNINSNFAALDNISYNNNGTMTFGSAGSDSGTSRTKTIQLFDPTSTSQSVGALNQEMLYNHSMIQILDQRTTAENQQIQNLQWQYHDLSRTVDKQSKAISVNAAFAALPSGYMPDKNFIGIGVGHFNNRTGVALGLTRSFDNGIIVQGRYGASGGTSVVSAAAGISF